MWVVLCIRYGHTDHYSRSGGGGTLGGVIYKDSKVGSRKFRFLGYLPLQRVFTGPDPVRAETHDHPP